MTVLTAASFRTRKEGLPENLHFASKMWFCQSSSQIWRCSIVCEGLPCAVRLLHLNSYVELWISLLGISLSVGPLVSFYFRLLFWRTNAQHFEGKSIKMAKQTTKTEDEVVYRFDFSPCFDCHALEFTHAFCAKLLTNGDGHCRLKKGAKKSPSSDQ